MGNGERLIVNGELIKIPDQFFFIGDGLTSEITKRVSEVSA
jgi:hypothetical protein